MVTQLCAIIGQLQPAGDGRAPMLKVHSWMRRADVILADEEFDLLAALPLVREILHSAGLSSSLRVTAEQAEIAVQAAHRSPGSKWQTAVAKQRFQMLRTALPRTAFRA